jgi:hypothetical protein
MVPMRFALQSPRSIARRALAGVLLAAFCIAGTGVMPSHAVLSATLARLLGGDSPAGDAFPCQDGGCGCSQAAECWTSCCCNTPHDRLVWALERGVMPPPIARFSDSQWIAAANAVKAGSAHCGSCVVAIKASLRKGIALAPPSAARGSESKSCCSSRKSAPESSLLAVCPAESETCCDGVDSSAKTACCDRPQQASEAAKRGLPCLSALGCKGSSPLLAVPLPPSLPAEAEVAIVTVQVPATPSCAAAPALALPWALSLAVAAPPPRLGR